MRAFYLGAGNYEKVLLDMMSSATPAIFYWYSPDPLLAKLPNKRVYFPEYTPGCSLSHDPTDPYSSGVKCDYPKQELKKVLQAALQNDPDRIPAFNLLRDLQLTEQDLNDMMQLHVQGGGVHTSVWAAACEGLKSNSKLLQTLEELSKMYLVCIGGYFDDVGFCVKCPAGSVVSNNTCAVCQPEFAENPGSVACEKCPENTNNWQPMNFQGLSADHYVPVAASDCIPIVGYYGEANVPATECPRGGLCCECSPEIPEELLLEELARNPEGYPCECLSGTVLPYPAHGYIRSTRQTDNMLECPASNACLGAPRNVEGSQLTSSSNVSAADLHPGICSQAYDGSLCGNCRVMYYRNKVSKACQQCPDMSGGQGPLMICAVLFFITVIFVYSLYQGQTFYKNGALVVLIDYLQTQASFFLFDLGWPKSIRMILRAASYVNFQMDMLSHNCMGNAYELTFYSGWVLKMLLPLLGFIIYGVVYAVMQVMGMYGFVEISHAKLWQAYIINGFFFATTLFYAYLINLSFSIFHCKEFDEGTTYLVENPSVECYNSEWTAHAVSLGVAGILVYAIGLLLVGFIFLYVNKPRLKEPVFKRSCGSLYAVFKEEYYYWEVTTKCKKLFMITMVVLFPNNTSLQVWSALVILLFCIILGYISTPYQSNWNNYLDSFASVSNYVTLSSGLYFYSERLSESEELVISVGLIFSLFFTLLMLIHGVVLDYVCYYGQRISQKSALAYIILDHWVVDKLFNSRQAITNEYHWAKKDKMLAQLAFQHQRKRSRIASNSLKQTSMRRSQRQSKFREISNELNEGAQQFFQILHGVRFEDLCCAQQKLLTDFFLYSTDPISPDGIDLLKQVKLHIPQVYNELEKICGDVFEFKSFRELFNKSARGDQSQPDDEQAITLSSLGSTETDKPVGADCNAREDQVFTHNDAGGNDDDHELLLNHQAMKISQSLAQLDTLSSRGNGGKKANADPDHVGVSVPPGVANFDIA
eukprot:gene10608-12547_t